MALVSPAQVTDGTAIDAADVNTPINQLATEINGNLDANNLATNAVPTAKIQDGAVTNAKLDTTAGAPGGAWATWAPTYANITVGDGTVFAKYVQIGKTVHFRWHIVCGSTTALGTSMTISLPVAAHADYDTHRFNAIGTCNALDLAPAIYGGWVMIDDSATVCTIRWNDGTAGASSVFPFTEATGDFFSVQGSYEAA